MAHSPHCFSSYNPCPSNKKISISDGSFTTVANQGKIHLTQSIVLQDVLYVTKFLVNLALINKLTKELNCCENFFQNY